MSKRENRSLRRGPLRESRPLLLAVCGADRTESDYLRGLRDHTRDRAADVKITVKGRDPAGVVRYAADYRTRSIRDFDEVWCVLDVDDFDIGAAVALADQSHISLAISNPCFELWLLLHHEDCRAELSGYSDVKKRLVKYIRTYDKSCIDFGDYVTGLPDAVRRAKALDSSGFDHLRNPSTSVWRLVEKIMG